LIDEALEINPDVFIDPYDEEDWPLDDEDQLDYLSIPKRATPYKAVQPKGKTVTKSTPAPSKSNPEAASTSHATAKSPKSKPSIAKVGLPKAGASRGAKKVDATKRMQDDVPDEMFTSSDDKIARRKADVAGATKRMTDDVPDDMFTSSDDVRIYFLDIFID
jgi:hypothetical protein